MSPERQQATSSKGGTSSDENGNGNGLMRRTANTVRNASLTATGTIRDYPVASSVIGAGIAAGLTTVALRAWRRSSGGEENRSGSRGKRSRRDNQSGALERAQEVLGSAKELVTGAMGEVREKASDLTTYAGEGLAKVGEAIKDGATAVEHGVEQGYEYTKEKAGELFENHPLAVTAGFLALGVVAGMLLPVTKFEKTVLGSSANELTRRVATKGRQLLDQGKQLAERAATQTGEVFREEMEALTPAKITRKVKRVASRLKDMVGEAEG